MDSNEKEAELYELTTQRMKRVTKADLKDIFAAIKGKDADLMAQAIRESKWDLCKEVFEFAAYRAMQKNVQEGL